MAQSQSPFGTPPETPDIPRAFFDVDGTDVKRDRSGAVDHGRRRAPAERRAGVAEAERNEQLESRAEADRIRSTLSRLSRRSPHEAPASTLVFASATASRHGVELEAGAEAAPSECEVELDSESPASGADRVDGRLSTRAPSEDEVETAALRRAATRARRRRRGWIAALSCLVGLVLAAGCGAGMWTLLRESPQAPLPESAGKAQPGSGVEAPEARSQSRGPLTIEELFAGEQLEPEGAQPYQVLGTEELADCSAAAIGGTAEAMADADCTQVLRATVASPDESLLATVGVANLSSRDEAERLSSVLEADVDGGFSALRAGGDSQSLGLNPTVLGFNAYGHFLLYAVVGRADGEAPSSQDDEVAAVVTDLVDVYLMDVLTDR